MNTIFKNDWMEIYTCNNAYFIKYNSGDLINSIREIEVSEEDAKRAQESGEAAYHIILHYDNIAMYGEDYLERRKQKP